MSMGKKCIASVHLFSILIREPVIIALGGPLEFYKSVNRHEPAVSLESSDGFGDPMATIPLPPAKNTRKSATSCLPKPQRPIRKPKLQVGESFPDGITVVKVEKITGPDHPIKTAVVITIIALCLAVFIALTVEAIIERNQQRLDSILSFDEKLLCALLICPPRLRSSGTKSKTC
jgi:hypothetical protein